MLKSAMGCDYGWLPWSGAFGARATVVSRIPSGDVCRDEKAICLHVLDQKCTIYRILAYENGFARTINISDACYLPQVNCRKVLAGMKLVGAPYTLVHTDYFTGKQKEEPYISLNPMASLPALKEGDFVLWESNAILQYAADKMNKESAYPKDLKTRADINRWLLWEASSWFPST